METTYDQPINDRICQKNESMQYNAAQTKNGAIKGAFQTKPHQEFGLESLKSRPWFRTLCTLYKIKPSVLPKYLFDIIPQKTSLTMLIQPHSYTPVAELVFFKKTFFLFVISEWNKLSFKTCNTESLLFFLNWLTTAKAYF